MSRSIAISLLAMAALGGCSAADRDAAAQSRSSEEGAMAFSPSADSSSAKAAVAGNESRSESAASVLPANRHIIREGTMSVRVKDLADAETSVMASLRRVGGYLESANGASLASETPQLTMTVRIPVAEFDNFAAGIGKLGDVLSRTASAQDVTDQIVDAEARMKAMRAEEAAYIEMLRQTRNLNDTLSVRQRLGDVRQQIEQLDAMRTALRGRAAMSSLTIDLQQASPLNAAPGSDPGWFAQTLGGATAVLGELARAVGGFLIYVAVLSPLWFPFAWLIWRSRRRALRSA